MPLTVPLHLVWDHDRALVGGKAANLAVLIRAKLPVPTGFCVTVAAFVQFLGACSQRVELSKLLSLVPTVRPHEAAQLSERLTTCFQDCAIPAPVQEAVLAAWRAQGEAREYAVRSSATVEDAQDHSFAGQFDSCLNVRGAEPLLAGLRKCWLSLFSARALAYFAKEHLPMTSAAMAVVIQEMIPAEAAGVIFTVDPVSGHAGRIVIEGVAGLGDRLVSGQVMPEMVVLERPTLRIVEHR